MTIDFSTWTKEDFLAMEARREEVFALTTEEILASENQYKEKVKLAVTDKLANIWVTYPKVIDKSYVIEFLDNINAKQFVWADLEWWVDNQIYLFGDIESAFNDLVFRYL